MQAQNKTCSFVFLTQYIVILCIILLPLNGVAWCNIDLLSQIANWFFSHSKEHWNFFLIWCLNKKFFNFVSFFLFKLFVHICGDHFVVLLRIHYCKKKKELLTWLGQFTTRKDDDKALLLGPRVVIFKVFAY